MAFHMCDRMHPDYYACDILSDLLCNGRSSRLVQHLVQEQRLFGSIDAYIAGSVDPGLFFIVRETIQRNPHADCRTIYLE